MAYPTMSIFSPLSRHTKFFGFGVYFAEKATNNGFLLSIQTLSILILSKTYPIWVYLAHYLDMHSFLALEFILLKRILIMDPYFQYRP